MAFDLTQPLLSDGDDPGPQELVLLLELHGLLLELLDISHGLCEQLLAPLAHVLHALALGLLGLFRHLLSLL
jgi:hypothetical protein